MFQRRSERLICTCVILKWLKNAFFLTQSRDVSEDHSMYDQGGDEESKVIATRLISLLKLMLISLGH